MRKNLPQAKNKGPDHTRGVDYCCNQFLPPLFFNKGKKRREKQERKRKEENEKKGCFDSRLS
jgi:hypothetical protein